MRRVPVVLLLAAAGCAAPQASAPAAGPEVAEMMATDRQFDADTAAEGAEGWVRYFAPNGVMLLGEAPAIAGHESILKVMSGAFGRPGTTLRWQPSDGGVLVPQTIGYTVGRYQSTQVGKDGQTKTETGTYVTIWRKQKDGTWKAVFDTGEADAAPKPHGDARGRVRIQPMCNAPVASLIRGG